ncbi:hypothetical protein BVC93_17350 [Mycobacterium sp. MS1601]|uniref:hypothetical protein n=1 Tax=Mycobacterium sp. MS1601 TaxID=1936029 RepID=UPI0009795919|nr:hypothetical protein [Mycobacterium sp. MS1601]AQA03902.1 hypothetical protein BVC93_17350 [Mycobacterium sp. MS1601]
MTQYGYRVFAVELHDGGKREPQPFGEAKRPVVDDDGKPTGAVHQFDYRDVVISDVLKHAMTVFPFGKTTEEEADETGPAQAKGMAVRFLGAVNAGDTIRIAFEHGVMNSDGTLIVDGEDVSMKDRPTLHPYRATLLAETRGTIALLAVEVRGRSCPSDGIIRGLKECSDVPWRLQVLGNLAGEYAMMAFIQAATVKRVVFDRWTFDDDGQRNRNDVSMSVAPDGVDVKSRVAEWAENFFEGFPGVGRAARIEVPDRDAEGKRLSRKQMTAARKQARAEQKAAEAQAKAERRSTAATRTQEATDSLRQDIFVNRDERVEVDFNDVAVELDDGTHQRKITPTTDFSRFTYVVGNSYVGDDKFYDQAEGTLRELLPSIRNLPLDP